MQELMPILYVLGGLVFLFACWSAFGAQPPVNKGPPPPPPAHRPVRKQPRPFDATAAQPLAQQVTISGPAYVVDGDTLVIRKTQIRLFGVDAPEIDHPYGQKAKWALVSLCKGKTIRAEILQKDVHDRTVAKCFLEDGRDLSAEMVKLGLAIDWPKYSGGVYFKLEVPGVRKKLWLADARQKGRMHVWDAFEARQKKRGQKKT